MTVENPESAPLEMRLEVSATETLGLMALAVLKGVSQLSDGQPLPGLVSQILCKQPYFVSVGLLTPLILNPHDLFICLFLILGEEFIPQL